MSPGKVVPDAVVLAAKRAFARTTAQAYATSLGAGLPSAAAVVAFVQDDNPAKWWLLASTLVLAAVSPLFAGLSAYLNIVGHGIPQDYADATTQIVDPREKTVITVPLGGTGLPVIPREAD